MEQQPLALVEVVAAVLPLVLVALEVVAQVQLQVPMQLREQPTQVVVVAALITAAPQGMAVLGL
jgi:hypothetical protein